MSEEIQTALQSIFQEVFDRPDLALTRALTAADVPGWDSFRYVSLIMSAEERFGVKFTSDDIDNLNNVGDLVDLVARKGGRP
jgi:acyl carrier protein